MTSTSDGLQIDQKSKAFLDEYVKNMRIKNKDGNQEDIALSAIAFYAAKPLALLVT